MKKRHFDRSRAVSSRGAAEKPLYCAFAFASCEVNPSLDLFIFRISDGRRLILPREILQAVHNATPEQAADIQIGQFGDYVWWPQVDEGHRLEGRYGNQAWMNHIQHQTSAAA